MKTKILHNMLYLIGPAIVLAVLALAVLPGLWTAAPGSIPITAPEAQAKLLSAESLTGLAASLGGALVLGISLLWLGRKRE